MDRFVVGLDPLPELEHDRALTVLDRAGGAVLIRVASSEVPLVRRYFEGAVHVYDSEAKARQVWRLFREE